MIAASVLYSIFVGSFTYNDENWSSSSLRWSFNWYSMPDPILQISKGRGFKLIIVAPPRCVKKVEFYGNTRLTADHSSENYYYTLNGKFQYEPCRFVYKDNETVFDVNEHLLVWIVYHLTDDPELNSEIDFYAKTSNPYIIYDTPDVLFGPFHRLNSTTAIYTNERGTLYSFDMLHAFLIVRCRDRTGLSTVFIPMGVSV